MAKYHYTRLSRASSIRLLTFEPPRTYPDGSIAIDLIEVDLTTHPEYDALSYTWGNMHDTVSIVVQDKTLNITTNLLAFLNRLYHESSAPEERKYFWADQICINQSDTKERNQQVAIMSDIYRSCQRTLIWLGEEDGDSEIFFGLLNRIQLLGFDRDAMLSMAIINRTCDDLRDYFGSPSDHLVNFQSRTLAILNTLNRPWFTRAWVIQEAALAPCCLVRIGDRSFCLELLDLFVICISVLERDNSQLLGLRASNALKTRGAHTIRHIQSWRGHWSTRKTQEGWGDFLQTMRELAFMTEASDPRDLVFAFLGLQEDRRILEPDYSLTTNEVYMYTSSMLAESTESLSIFGTTRFHNPFRLPSWAVDWRLNETTQGSPLTDPTSRFSASRGYRYKACPRDRLSPVLTVNGKTIDIIGAVSVLDNHLSGRIGVFKIKELTQEMTRHLVTVDSRFRSESEVSEGSVQRRALKVLLAQNHKASYTDAEWDAELDRMLQLYRTCECSPTSLSLSEDQRSLVQVARRMSGKCRSRRLIVSQSRFSFGLAPRVTQQGDHVCILHGSDVPIVLRPSGARYQVVGQCYFEEWMYGELVDWKEDEADVFELE